MKRLFLICSLLAVAATPADNQITVHASADKLVPGGAVHVTVEVELAEPWHNNANPPSLPELIPTTLKMESSETVQFGEVTYPVGEKKTVSWADQPVMLYAGKAVISVAGKVAGNAPLGPVTLKGTLRYQACDNQVCYAPKSVPVVVAAEIVQRGSGRAESARGAGGPAPSTGKKFPR